MTACKKSDREAKLLFGLKQFSNERGHHCRPDILFLHDSANGEELREGLREGLREELREELSTGPLSGGSPAGAHPAAMVEQSLAENPKN